MQIHDAHSHFFSRSFFDALAGLSPLDGTPEQLLSSVAEKTGMTIPEDDTDAHRDRWLAEMDRAGVERMVTFASAPAEAEAVAAAVAGSAGRLVGYTVVDPTAAGAAAFAETALTTLGLRGLLTFPAMHHVHPREDRFSAICEVAARHRAPVLVHCGLLKIKLRDLLGLPRAYDLSYADPLGVIPAAQAFPDVPFVLPHFGGGFLREALMAGDMCENILVDTSSSNAWMRTSPGSLSLADVFRSALEVFGPARILFGTDSCTFPRGWRDDVRDEQLTALSQAGADDAAVADIMGGNLARLLP